MQINTFSRRITLLLFLVSSAYYGSLSHDLVTDRPGFYNNPQTVDNGSVVTEFGLQYSENNLTYNSIDFALNTIKYGIADNVELRLGLGVGFSDATNKTRQNLGIFGAKVNFIESENDILSTEFSFSLPAADTDEYLAPLSNLSLLYTRKLNESFALSTNLRYSFIDFSFPSTNIVDFHLALEHTVTDNFGWLLESWTQVDLQRFDSKDQQGNRKITHQRPGFTGANIATWYRFTPWWQVDLQFAAFKDIDNDPNTIINNASINIGSSFLLN